MDNAQIESLKQEFSGEVIIPGNGAYEQARNSFIHKGSPAVILRPTTANDVAAAIRFGRTNKLTISVRSGGHSGAGLSTNTGGLVIDLSAMNTVEVIDKQKNLVRIQSGAVWKKVAATLSEYGLALSSGDTTSVGVGGLATGGGIGWMVRKYGLTIDSMVAAEIVTADGNILRTSANDNPDLFWGIRGGGGNFGIVTSFEFTAHPVREVYSGMIIYSLDNLPGLLKGWRDYMRVATEDLTVIFLLLPSFFGNPPSAIGWCTYAGDDESGMKKAIEPMLNIGTVVQNNVIKKSYVSVLEDPHPPEGVKIIVRNGFVQNFSDELIEAIASTHCKEISPALQLRSVGGAMNRIDAAATAFAHRSSELLMISATFIPLDATVEQEKSAMIPWNTIAPFTNGAYVNFFSTATEEDVALVYPTSTYERLAELKKRYDPQNIFNQNYNIKPSK